LSRSVL